VLWHLFQALNELENPGNAFECCGLPDQGGFPELVSDVEDLHACVKRNQAFVPNYGERYRNWEKIAFGAVESAINRVVSKRIMKKQ
jgi:hypothetical protein